MSEEHGPTQAPPVTTTDAGIPAASDEHSLTVGPEGPIVLQDHYLIQKMQAFNRERVPERVVHAKEFGRKAHMPNRKAAELRSMDALEARLNAEKPTSRPSF